MDDIWIVNIAAKLCIIPKRARNFINAFGTLRTAKLSYYLRAVEEHGPLVNAVYYFCV